MGRYANPSVNSFEVDGIEYFKPREGHMRTHGWGFFSIKYDTWLLEVPEKENLTPEEYGDACVPFECPGNYARIWDLRYSREYHSARQL